MRKNLTGLLGQKRFPRGMDCKKFVVHLLGKSAKILEDGRKQRTVPEENLKVGDVVFVKKNEVPVHLAVYMGHGIYLSKFGQCGIYATTFGDMALVYGGASAITVCDK
jgi:hypothetical protein